jgi:hypothetical protein
MMLPTLPNDARDGESPHWTASMPRAMGRNRTSERKAMAKKRVPKRRAWNKGLEVGKRDGFTSDQVKRIRGLLVDRGVPGLRDLALFSTAIDTMLHGQDLLTLVVGMCSVAMVQYVPLSRLRARGGCHQCDAPCPTHPQGRLKNGSRRPAKNAPIIYSLAVALRAVIRCRLTQHSLPGGSLRPTWAGFAPAESRQLCLAPSTYSITSSASAMSVGGMASPSALAAAALMTNSTLVDCVTGRSRGASPLRMRAVHSPTRR